MSRRAEVEALLRRCGEPASCGGDPFPAIVRPLRFSSQAGAENGGMDCLYTGPAARKLAAGDTVLTRGRACRVVRSETVILSGEELYVRAVLRLLPPGADGTVRIVRGGTALAAAESYTVKARQASEAEVPWGGDAPDEISAGAIVFELTLENVIPEEGADPFGAGSFDVEIARGQTKTVYSGCRWKSIRNTGGLTGAPEYEMEILAAKRAAAEQEAEGNG